MQVTHSLSLHLDESIYQLNISANFDQKTGRITPYPEMYHLQNGNFKLLGEKSLEEIPQVKEIFLTYIRTTLQKPPYA
jgi:hypothetical protein